MKKKIIISSSVGAIFLFILMCILLKDCIFPHTTNELSFWSFDTTVTIKIYDEKKGNDYLKHISDEFKNISNACDDYHGEVYELNENRYLHNASDYLVDILNKSIEIQEETNGYFNPLMGRLTHLYKDEEKRNKLTEEDILNELNIIKDSFLFITPQNFISITGDANVDLGAIAKGYATQLAVDYLKSKKVDNYLINCGESSISVGSRKHRIGLLKPQDSSRDYYKKIILKDTGISTSAITYQDYHIISPKTGHQETYYKSISIISEDNLRNDAYSTALFSMNETDMIDFANKKDLDIYAYTEENKIINV